MSDYYVGDTIRDYFTEIDINSVPIVGDTFVVDETLDPDGDPFALGVDEIDPGTYRVSFLASKGGTYYYQIHGTSVPNQYFEETFVVSPILSSALVSIDTAAYGTSLIELIPMIADELRDLQVIEATQNGASDGTSFQAEVDLAARPSASLRGASLITVEPAVSDNYWIERRISQFDENTQVASLTPALPSQVMTGDVAWVINLKSQGYNLRQYISAANRAIRRAFPNHLVPISYTYPNPFVYADGTIVTPTHMTHLYRVETVDEGGVPITVPMNPMGLPCNYAWGGNCNGWYYDYTQNSIVVRGNWGLYLEGKDIRLQGFGRDAKLVNPTDMTSIPPEWIVNQAAASLKRSQEDKRLLADASQLSNEADKDFISIITMLPPGVIRIR